MLEAGTKLGPYEIVSPLGAGGMGEVYRAKDTRLGRDVAVKVLPQHLSANPEVRARFEREAKTVSSLNHPNICTLFDVGREGETDYLVMELVEGETLAERLRKGPLATAELLRLGAQVADALDRAHRAGVIHRDLKPGNVMITRGGAKLMDFGLARASGLAGPGSSSGSLSGMTQSPTVAAALTAEGAIVGTFQYMSPEQLEGKEADARSDIWALGCVLYEMASGRRAFEARSQASLIAAILEREPARLGDGSSGSGAPSASGISNGPPPGLDRLVRACLAKDPEERLQTAHDAKLQLQWIAESQGVSSLGVAATTPVAVATPVRRGDSRLAWGVAAAAVLAAVAFAVVAWPKLTATARPYRFHPDVVVAGTHDPYWPRVSPDGRSLVFQALDSTGVSSAYLLRLDETTPHPIPGTQGLQRAYWSPDSKEITFCANGKMQRVAVAGGSPLLVCPAPNGADLSWSSKGVILLDGANADSLRMVPAGGGELRPATRVYRSDRESGNAWPCFLPDGEHFVFCGIRTDGSAMNIRLGNLGTLDSKLLGRSDGRVEVAPGGWLVYLNGSAVLAQKLDLGAGKLTGERLTLVDDVRVGTSAGHFSFSRDGVFAVQHAGATSGLEMHLATRAGVVQPAVLTRGDLWNPRLSPDGTRVLYDRHAGTSSNWGEVGVVDLTRGTDTQLTFTNTLAVGAQWSPDGKRIAYTKAPPDAKPRLVIEPADGLGAQDSVIAPGSSAYLSQWAAAGSRLIAFTDDGAALAVASDGGERALKPLAAGLMTLGNPQVSPDGRWVCGSTGVSPSIAVFVQSLEQPSGRWQVSASGGGYKPRWTKGGHEVVYESLDQKLMAVDIDASGGFHAGMPHLLFSLPAHPALPPLSIWTCDEAGERFVVLTPSNAQAVGQTIEISTDFGSLVHRK